MADLEQLAIKRDRGYLLRLIAMLLIGLAASGMIWQWLTGDRVTGCVANTFLGQDAQSPAPNKAKPATPAH